MSVSEFAEEVNWEELYQAANDGLPEYDGQTEWREPFDLAQRLKVGFLELGIMPPETMPDVLYKFVLWRRDGYLADSVQERWDKVQVPFGFTQAILVSEIYPDFMLRRISPAEVTQNSAQCIMNLCVVLQERDGEFFIPSTFIANWLGIKQQTASMILKKLEQAGYLVRRGNFITCNGNKTPLWLIGDGVPLKKEPKPRKKKNRPGVLDEKEPPPEIMG